MEGTPNKSVQSFAGSRTEKSTGSSHHREAEQNDSFTRREYTCADFIEALRLIDQEAFKCSIVLNDFSMRANITEPSYRTVKLDGICSTFVSSVLAGGYTYTGEVATIDGDAKENAARVAIKSILVTRSNHMLESIRSNKPTGTTIQGEQSSQQTSAHPAVIFTPPASNNIPCAPHHHYMLHAPFAPLEQMQWRHPGTPQMVPVFPHEQIQWRHPTPVHMPFHPHEQMQCRQSPAPMPFLPREQMQWRHPAAPMPTFLPHEQMQWHNPVAQMAYLPPEQMQRNVPIAHTPSEVMQMWQLPQSISNSNPVLQNGLYSNTGRDDDMVVEVGSAEETMTLSGTKRKMDQTEEALGKQARTTK
uniref:DRBM domain-containing protein n=1 Tax=Oryza meridionalis TaxID=40149 RepID=A0A0E0EQV5_9ORYZ